MAAVSTQPSPYGSPAISSPPLKGLKKVLSGRRRSSEVPSESSIHAFRTDSIDSINIDRSPTRQSLNSSPSREGSTKSGSSGVRKLLPGHTKRKRRRVREEELKIAAEEAPRGRDLIPSSIPPAALSRKTSSLTHDGDSSLLTDDSEVDAPPPLVSRDSHTGYLTTSSPLIKSTTLPDRRGPGQEPVSSQLLDKTPSIVEPQSIESSPSPRSHALTSESTPVLPLPGLIDKADTLRPEGRRHSISKLRGKSPARKFKDAFTSRLSKSPRTSPERPYSGVSSPLSRGSTFAVNENHETLENSQSRTSVHSPVLDNKASTKFPPLETETRPFTPPAAVTDTPVTTITPPTPTDKRFEASGGSPKLEKDDSTSTVGDPRIVVSPSGGMISHRRVRSAGSGSGSHMPSKLSNSVTAPLTPTIEEARTPSGGMTAGRTVSGSFFSSWVSAAQNAATSITNLTAQTRGRSGTTTSDPAQHKQINEIIKEEPEIVEPESESPRKQLAVETLGAGELNFGHLGLERELRGENGSRPGFTELRNNSVLQRDVAAAKEEDMLAKRAVSAAYERPNESTPVAEVPDPINNVRHAQTFSGAIGGEHTPPNGSIFESEAGSIKRNNSVRSKIATRRSRGSSAATGQSAIGAMIGASTAALANPASGPRLTGFAIAPKLRNRNFHQQFRSVPEDDYLVEDYSCALQREILLAGRIYISEGHICFSSNILGWVTTLVISFEEIVSIEKENTALVIPNAIAIQTLHARHTFRSLLSREATYDLLIGIWKVSHPASFQKSINGKQMAAEEATKEATGTGAPNEGSAPGSEGTSDEEDGTTDDEGSAPSLLESAPSVAGSEPIESKTISRKPSAMNGAALVQVATMPSNTASDAPPVSTPPSGSGEGLADFPGPTTHAPTECTDGATHYDVIIKDEVLSAPLGKIYTLLYGPQSGAFCRKFLLDECKVLDLSMEDDKKGLGADVKSRQYNYIKPLGGSIGPKQTKCITTETLDFFDLEKAVTVTCSTQTPDVPSGNAFLTKTRYCLTWAPGNSTRLQMNCTIEWSAKSWLKNPIEKGAKDGQQQYGDSLIKVLKNAVGRPRSTTAASKVSKSKKKRKGERKERGEKVEAEVKREENWGLLEPLRGTLGPFVDIVRPVWKTEYMVGVLFAMVLLLWFRGPRATQLGPHANWRPADRLAAYEEMWSREESELWNWLEDRTGVDSKYLQENVKSERQKRQNDKQKLKQRQKALKSKNVETRLREEKMSEMEMMDAIRITKERLEVLEGAVENRKAKTEA